MPLTRLARSRMNVGEPAYPVSAKPVAAKPIKLDFSKMTKMHKKAASAPFEFPKSAEQKLAEALAEIETLKAEISNKNAKIAELSTKLVFERKN